MGRIRKLTLPNRRPGRRGICTCCGIDYTGLDREGDDLDGEPLTSNPWRRDIINHANRVDFDNDERETIATVRMVRSGGGYAVIIDQLSDVDRLIIKHTNE